VIRVVVFDLVGSLRQMEQRKALSDDRAAAQVCPYSLIVDDLTVLMDGVNHMMASRETDRGT
jgi:hypothetical protein